MLGFLVAGCDGDPNDPNGSVLQGRWGAVEETPALLVALSVGAELDLGCSSVGTDDPVELGPDGTFAFSGQMQLSGLVFDPPRATVQGRVQGDVVTLTLDIHDDDGPTQPYTLEQGVDPGFEDDPPICPQ